MYTNWRHCEAKGRLCRKCNKFNHWSSQCFTKPENVHAVEEFDGQIDRSDLEELPLKVEEISTVLSLGTCKRLFHPCNIWKSEIRTLSSLFRHPFPSAPPTADKSFPIKPCGLIGVDAKKDRSRLIVHCTNTEIYEPLIRTVRINKGNLLNLQKKDLEKY